MIFGGGGLFVLFCFKQKTAYEMRISDWSSDGCSADLRRDHGARDGAFRADLERHLHLEAPGEEHEQAEDRQHGGESAQHRTSFFVGGVRHGSSQSWPHPTIARWWGGGVVVVSGVSLASICKAAPRGMGRSEEHTSELQSLMRISYAVFCLKKKK